MPVGRRRLLVFSGAFAAIPLHAFSQSERRVRRVKTIQ